MEGANNVRLGFLFASAALAAGLALSACSSGAGSSSAVPSSLTSSGAHTVAMGQSHGRHFEVRLAPGVRQDTIDCNYSEFNFCFYVTPGNPGPYVESSTGQGYELYNHAYFIALKNTKDKKDRKFKNYFYPDPGNPTYQYINYKGRAPKKDTPVKWTDFYCIGFAPGDCTGRDYTLKLGVALTPAS
jgi:hypothetical protein